MLAPLPLTALPADAQALRVPVRAFLHDALAAMPVQRRARSWMGWDPDFSRALAARGWVGLTLPPAYGGGGRDAFARFVLVEELLAAGAPVGAHWIADRQSAPLILRYGTEAQRRFYLPRICRAEAFFCIGMSEPGSGSDLASVRTRATPAGESWRLSGQKIWTSGAQLADYAIVLARSSGSADDRQRGLSQFIVDLKLPGITIRPIVDLAGDAHFNEVFFDDVALGADALVGREGEGWAQVNAELAFERSGPERILSSMVLVEQWLEWLRGVADPPAQCVAALGRIAAQLMVLRQLSIAVTARLVAGESPLVEAALVKDMGTTLEQQIPETIGRLLDLVAEPPPPLLAALAYIATMAPAFSLRGGTREILRGMIARALGMR
jgi:alkylation response protein AidB-like acyl-CoA dehydrogenase